MARQTEAPDPISIESIRRTYLERKEEIRERLAEFAEIGRSASDEVLFEEMVFCFFTGGCSARMGINSLAAVRPLLNAGSQSEIAAALAGSHRYPNARARYVFESREFLRQHCGLRLRNKLQEFADSFERREWLVKEKGIKGLGYKEASHYLRNIGFTGLAILDKHVLNCLAELKIIDDPKPPNSRDRYLSTEERLRELANKAEIGFDELDLVLWSMKTGVILK